MITILALHLIAALICLAPGEHARRWTLGVATVPPLIGFVWLCTQAGAVLDGQPVVESVGWVPQIGLNLDLRLDGFALLMGLLVTGIGVLVFTYSISYFTHERAIGRMAGLLVAFAGAMLGLVLSDGLLTLFVFWELTSITSFLLIGFDDRSTAARTAAVRALLVTGMGGLCLLAGLLILGQQADTGTISQLLADAPTGAVVNAALVLVLIGAFTKSAQWPFHFWLPGAMAAPTPVSAYLHSATMVKAGIVVIARFAPAFAEAGPWRPMVVTAGVITMFVGGLGALAQQDAKLALAHGTVSQLGLLVVLFGLGTPETTFAGVVMLTAHALFKAALFLIVGIIDHGAHTRDLRRLQGLTGRLPIIATAAFLAAASMAAIPPTLGFVAKEAGLDGLIDADIGLWGVVALVGVASAAVLTVAYTGRWTWFAFRPTAPGTLDGQPGIDPARVHHPSPAFAYAPVLLAGASLVLGLVAPVVSPFFDDVAGALTKLPEDIELALWHGPTTALAVSVVVLALGAALTVYVVRRESGRQAPAGRGERAYATTYDELIHGAKRVTRYTQSGSLPAYLGIVFTTLLVIVVVALLSGIGDAGGWPWADSALQVVAAILTGLMGLSVLTARRRFTAAVLLGGTGYGLAIVFLIYGAPDLALTQFLVETITIVMFLLVLGRLPDRWAEGPRWAPSWVRILIAGSVGAAVAAFAMVISVSRTAPSVGDEYLARTVPEGGGRNSVNVTLVDFRGFDTQGEITVLAVAAVGVVNIVGVARREQRRKRLLDGTDDITDDLASDAIDRVVR